MTEAREWSDIGERIRQARLARGWSQADLAGRVGLDRTMVAKIEAGTRRIDAVELTRLAAALDLSLDHFLYGIPAVLSRRAGMLTGDDSALAGDGYRLEAALSSWLREVSQLVDLGLLRPTDPVRYPERVTSAARAREAATWCRDRLGYGDEPIASLMGFCEQAGQYVLVTDLAGEGASAVDNGLAAAVVSLRGDPGRRRSTAAHELGHLVLGDEYSADLGIHASRAEREAAVDAFAAELLLPTSAITSAAKAQRSISREALIELAARYRTSWTMALRQAEHARLLPAAERRRLGQVIPTRAEFMEAIGWVPQPDLESVRVPPTYAHAVVVAYRQGSITRARAVELMHGQIAADDLPEPDDTDLAP